MRALRMWLVGLLAVSTTLFAVGVLAERSRAVDHTPPTAVEAHESGEPGAEGSDGHAEAEGASGRTDERTNLLGVDTESTTVVVLAVIAGFALAAVAAIQPPRAPAMLWAISLIALGWAALDVREVLHQLDEAHNGIAAIAMVVACLHLAAAAVAGRLAARTRQAGAGAGGSPGTMRA